MKKKPTSPRVQRNRDATIQSILDTARAIMREEGVAALSMHELARRMDMRAPSLYNYFTSKVEAFDVEMDNSSSELIDYFLKKRTRR